MVINKTVLRQCVIIHTRQIKGSASVSIKGRQLLFQFFKGIENKEYK